MGSRKKRVRRGSDRTAAVPGRRQRKQIEVTVQEDTEREDRVKYVTGRLKELKPKLVAKLLAKDAANLSQKSIGPFSKELKVLMSLVGGIPGMEGETRRFLNIAKRRRGEKRQGGWW